MASFPKIPYMLMIFLCANFLPAQSKGNADAAARDAVARLEDALAGKSSAGTVKAPPQASRGGAEPAWVMDPYRLYSRDRYMAAVGFAPNRSEAEKKALAALAALFGQSVKADFSAATMYSEAVSKGIISVSENTSIRDQVATAASMDSLMGAEIGNVWDDAKGTVYAAAYMDREKTIVIYTELIRSNQRNIDELTDMSPAEKNSFDGIARYRLAASMAGINAKYANVISQAGGSASSLNLKSADSYSLEASAIQKAITVVVTVEGDRANRIRDAFAKALQGEGLRTRGNNPPYELEVSISLGEVSFPNNNNKFCRYVASANLIENETGTVLISFNVADREGHATYEGAQTAAYTAIEREIAEKYPATLKEYLASLLPQKR
ncbi:hypothetical protein FACS189485_00680 [Spirochaetia bacterium]|nr:hypothetical protein FACS189485_00680 [Spirochaetia bacterium]